MKTLSYRGLTVKAGLSHQQSNLSAMLREAYLCGRTLVLPEFRLAGYHNYGREIVSRLTEYFDFPQVTVVGEAVRVLLPGEEGADPATGAVALAGENLTGRPESVIIKEVSGCALLRPVLEAVYPGFAELDVAWEIHPRLRAIVEAVSGRIPPGAAWVHVRRGDILHRTAAATTPENIRRMVATAAPETQALYIATNEPDLRYFEPLTEHYDVACLEDFPEFIALALEDNYKLFLVEQAFGQRFPVRISTFRTPGDDFQGYLCEAPGWQ